VFIYPMHISKGPLVREAQPAHLKAGKASCGPGLYSRSRTLPWRPRRSCLPTVNGRSAFYTSGCFVRCPLRGMVGCSLSRVHHEHNGSTDISGVLALRVVLANLLKNFASPALPGRSVFAEPMSQYCTRKDCVQEKTVCPDEINPARWRDLVSG
jgi:hypothetical protein